MRAKSSKQRCPALCILYSISLIKKNSEIFKIFAAIAFQLCCCKLLAVVGLLLKIYQCYVQVSWKAKLA